MGAPPRGSAPQPLRARARDAVGSARPWEPFTWRQKFCYLEKFMTSVTSSACWLVFLNLPPACWFESERPIDFFFLMPLSLGEHICPQTRRTEGRGRCQRRWNQTALGRTCRGGAG